MQEGSIRVVRGNVKVEEVKEEEGVSTAGKDKYETSKENIEYICSFDEKPLLVSVNAS